MSENKSASKGSPVVGASKDLNAIWNLRLILGFLGFAAGMISFLGKTGTLNFLTEIESQILAVTAIIVGLTVITSGVLVSRMERK